MPVKSKPMKELGNVSEVGGLYRAHVHYRNAGDQQVNIYGPRREHRHRALKDLEDMRAAGAVGSTREKGLEIICICPPCVAGTWACKNPLVVW